MIRQKTILCKLNELKISDQCLLDSMIPQCEHCPNCGAVECCRPHGSYERDMVSLHHGRRVDTVITVRRVKCSSCGKTHALLSDLLIPFSSYSLRFVLHVLGAYLTRTQPITDLCDSFCIAVSTLYQWIHLFHEQANLLLSAIEQFSWINTAALGFVEELACLPSFFFSRYRFSFLQDYYRQTVGGDSG